MSNLLKDLVDWPDYDETARKEAIDLVLICAKDIVDAWPTLTFRTLISMTKRIDTLAQALKEVK